MADKQNFGDNKLMLMLIVAVIILYIFFYTKKIDSAVFLFVLASAVFVYIFLKTQSDRPSAFKAIAEKYNLVFSDPCSFPISLLLPLKLDRKNNIIEGEVNGKNVLVYDLSRKAKPEDGFSTPLMFHTWGVCHTTIVSINGVERGIRDYRGFGFAPPKKIDSILANL